MVFRDEMLNVCPGFWKNTDILFRTRWLYNNSLLWISDIYTDKSELVCHVPDTFCIYIETHNSFL